MAPMQQEKNPYPFKWRSLNEEERAERRKWYENPGTTCGEDVIISEPGGIILPKQFKDIAEEIYNFELRPDDVWVVTFPKCGTTWTQEMVWQIRHGFDLEGGQELLGLRFPFLEMQMFVDPSHEFPPEVKAVMERDRMAESFEVARTLKSPRCIKTHLPLFMLPPALLDTCKVIFVCRNPKDCCVSYFHHEKLGPMMGFSGEFPEYARMFIEGKTAWGDYWTHIGAAWKYRNHPNMRLLWFEDMKKDLKPIIRDLSKFLGRHLTELKVLQLDDHLYIDNFKKNLAVNFGIFDNPKTGQAFIRKGAVGDWKNNFTPAMAAEWKKWIEVKKFEHGIERDLSGGL